MTDLLKYLRFPLALLITYTKVPYRNHPRLACIFCTLAQSKRSTVLSTGATYILPSSPYTYELHFEYIYLIERDPYPPFPANRPKAWKYIVQGGWLTGV